MAMTYSLKAVRDADGRVIGEMLVDELDRPKPQWESDLERGTPQPYRAYPRCLYRGLDPVPRLVGTRDEEEAARAAGYDQGEDASRPFGQDYPKRLFRREWRIVADAAAEAEALRDGWRRALVEGAPSPETVQVPVARRVKPDGAAAKA